jgi:hypothetical protein
MCGNAVMHQVVRELFKMQAEERTITRPRGENRMRSGCLVGAVFVLAFCGCGGEAKPATSCASVGGSCLIGGNACTTRAPAGADDCNSDRNPGGAFCCLVREAGRLMPGEQDADPIWDGSAATPMDAAGDDVDPGDGAATGDLLVDLQRTRTSVGNINAIASDDKYLYVLALDASDLGTAVVIRVRLSDGAAVVLSDAKLPNNLALDSTFVYWTEESQVARAAKAGRGVEVVADAQAHADGVAIADGDLLVEPSQF